MPLLTTTSLGKIAPFFRFAQNSNVIGIPVSKTDFMIPFTSSRSLSPLAENN
jgi:hypothetical protein